MGSNYENWHKTRVEKCKAQIGEKNPNYGNDTLHNIVKDNPKLRIKWYSRKDEQNGRAVAIRVSYPDGTEIGTFKTIGKCCEFLKEKFGFTATIDSMRSNITQSIKHNKLYRNLLFERI